MFPVDALSLEDQVVEGQVQQGFDLFDRPVMADGGTHSVCSSDAISIFTSFQSSR
jgi:hypothetical protein